MSWTRRSESASVKMEAKMSLPPLLAPDLAVVFVGTEPGRDSVEVGCYYANPRNQFYKHLADARFTPYRLSPAEFENLLAYGIGLDDVYDDPAALRARLEAISPGAVCFNSQEALRRFAGVGRIQPPWRAAAARRYADIADVTWALTDSSWTARAHWSGRLHDLRALRRALVQ